MLSNQSPLRAQGSVHPGLRGGMHWGSWPGLRRLSVCCWLRADAGGLMRADSASWPEVYLPSPPPPPATYTPRNPRASWLAASWGRPNAEACGWALTMRKARGLLPGQGAQAFAPLQLRGWQNPALWVYTQSRWSGGRGEERVLLPLSGAFLPATPRPLSSLFSMCTWPVGCLQVWPPGQNAQAQVQAFPASSHVTVDKTRKSLFLGLLVCEMGRTPARAVL